MATAWAMRACSVGCFCLEPTSLNLIFPGDNIIQGKTVKCILLKAPPWHLTVAFFNTSSGMGDSYLVYFELGRKVWHKVEYC